MEYRLRDITKDTTNLKIKNLNTQLQELLKIKKSNAYKGSKFLTEDKKAKKNLNSQIKNLKDKIKNLQPSKITKVIKTVKSINPIGAFLTAMSPLKTATDEQMKIEMKKMNKQKFNQGGKVKVRIF